MIRSHYRPWGQLSSILDNCSVLEWDLYGSLSTEERCLAVRTLLADSGKLRSTYLALIEDVDSPYKKDVVHQLRNRLQEFYLLGGIDKELHKQYLFYRKSELIEEIIKFIEKSNGNIIIDISSLPKRFFFLIVKLLLKSEIKNLIACYTIPQKYPDSEIAEDFESWRPLPLFEGNLDNQKVDVYFIGAGHMTMGLPEQLIAISDEVKIFVFVPFPGHPLSVGKVWGFVHDIERNLPPRKIERKVVCARDVPEIFEYLIAQTNKGERKALFAPYGPKPMSLAMCIFACQSKVNAPVYYTQPRVYLPDYSSGVAILKGKPQTYAYCLRLDGIDLYQIP